MFNEVHEQTLIGYLIVRTKKIMIILLPKNFFDSYLFFGNVEEKLNNFLGFRVKKKDKNQKKQMPKIKESKAGISKFWIGEFGF